MISRTSLERGPTLVIDSDSSAAVSAIYLWFRVGSALEPEAMAGAAHFLEHLLFKGAGHHGVGEAAARIEGLGGELNAYTTYEQTVLHATVPAGREEVALALLAEMACRPHLDAAEIDRERTVVIEELRGTADEAGQVLADALRARIYGAHPYGRPILGTEAALRSMDRDALAAFHAQHYALANAVIAVAGPVDPEALRVFVQTRLPAPGLRPTRVMPEPGPTPRSLSKRVFTLDADFEERLVEMAFPVPGLAHPDMAALDLLVTALGDGDASLLSAALKVELGLAVDTWAALENELAGGLLVFGLSAREGRSAEAAEALAAALAEVARRGIPTAALHRARTAVLSSRVYDRETADGRAHRLAWYEAFFGDPSREAAYEAEIMRVTPTDVRRVAATWLQPDRGVCGAVAPKRQLGRDRLASAVGRGWERRAIPPPGRDGRLVEAVLSCGARLVIAPDDDAELGSVAVVGVGGVLVEGKSCPGLSDLWAATAGRGAGELDAGAFAESIEERAGTLSPWAWRNSTGFSATFPAGELGSGLELLSAVLRAPRFDLDEVNRARAELDEAREGAEDSPGDLAWDLAWQLLYAGHPWGRPAHGTRAGLAASSGARLRRYHQRIFSGKNLVIAMAGAVDPDRVIRRLNRSLAALPEGEAVPWKPPAVPETFQRRRRRVVPRQQTHLVWAFPGLGWGQPDAPALALAEAVLGGQGGRLFHGLRERRGLAYEVSASAEEGLGGGTFLCSVATDPDRVAEAEAALWEELDALVHRPVPAAELDRVRARLVDGAALDLQRSAARAAHLAAAERYGPGAAQYKAILTAPGRVDAATLARVAASVFRRDRVCEVVVGPGR